MEPPLNDYEKKHIELLRNSCSECTLFLKKNNEFPIKNPGKVVLIGPGARETLKSGTGSSDVESRYFTTCEQGLENAGFKIVSKKWLDEYPSFKKDKHGEFVEYINSEAEKNNAPSWHFSMGHIQPEVEYDLPLNEYEGDIAVYVLSRNSGEAADRRLIKGDVLLTDSEIRDILFLNKKFKKFILVLNVCGVVDLSHINEVNNILLLSMLGVVTGDILADILLGKVNPSGKLTTTWAKIEDYKFIKDFGDVNDTRYVEGVYVGYRYFNSANIKPLYPFGFGKSYTKFDLSKISITKEKEEITVKIKVLNVGDYSGKEVAQIYISPPQNNKDKPYQSLIAFKKTKELKPKEEEILSIKFNFKNISRYDEKSASYILDNGKYIIRVGNSSDNTSIYGCINLNEDIVVEILENKCSGADFEDYKPNIEIKDDLTNIETITMKKEDFEIKKADYKYENKIDEKLMKLTDDDLVNLCVGHYLKEGQPNFPHILGAAGETTLHVKEIDKYILMADGPAGLRIAKKCGEDEKGKYRLFADPIRERMRYYLPKSEWEKEDHPENNTNRKGKEYYQFATALPIATAIGQTFNENFAKMCGDIVVNEMDKFNIHILLAPGLNIHRNILCGRNFEYISEDPLVSGKIASAIVLAVQSHKNRAATIKHFACNNQEFNRKNSNSIVSERAIREIYIKGFEIAVKESKPICLMTSYNLLNGIHSSERKDLIIDILRCEWGFKGLIMSDWYRANENVIGISKYPAQSPINNIKEGNNLQMGGRIINYNELKNSVKSKQVSRDDLLKNASIIYSTIELLNKK